MRFVEFFNSFTVLSPTTTQVCGSGRPAHIQPSHPPKQGRAIPSPYCFREKCALPKWPHEEHGRKPMQHGSSLKLTAPISSSQVWVPRYLVLCLMHDAHGQLKKKTYCNLNCFPPFPTEKKNQGTWSASIGSDGDGLGHDVWANVFECPICAAISILGNQMLPVKFQSTQSDVHGKCAVLIPETGTLAKKYGSW